MERTLIKRILTIFIITVSGLVCRDFTVQLQSKGNIEGYTIVIPELDIILETDADGNAFNPLENRSYTVTFTNGTYRFQISKSSFESTETVIISNDTPSVITITVDAGMVKETEVKRLDEVYIKKKKDRSRTSKNVLHVDEAKFIPGTGGDPLRSIVNFPGVVSSSVFSSYLFIRGGDPEDVLYSYGLVPIYTPFHRIGFYSVFSDTVIDSINFYPAAYPLEYGNSQGALIEIVPKEYFDKKKLHFDFDANLAVAKGNVTIPITDNLQLSFGGKRSYYEFYLGIVTNIKAVREELGDFNLLPFYYDGNVKLDWELNKNHYFSLAGIVYKDRVEFKYDNFPLTNSEGQTNVFTIDMDFENTYNLESFYYRFEKENIMNRFYLYRYAETLTAQIFNLEFITKKTHYAFADACSVDFLPWYSLHFGGSAAFEQEPYELVFFKDESFFTNEDMDEYDFMMAFKTNEVVTNEETGSRFIYSAYADNEFTIDRFSILLGLRSEYNTLNRLFTIEPRGSLSYNIKDDFNVYTRIGRYTQRKSIYPFMIDIEGNPDLANQSSMHYVVGTELLLLKDYLVKSEVYYKHLYDQVLRNPDWNSLWTKEQKRDNPQYINTGEGEAWGFEAMIRRRITKGIFGWLSYSYSHSLRKEYYNLNTMTMSAGQGNGAQTTSESLQGDMQWRLHNYDIPHTFNTVFSWEIIKNKLKVGIKYTIQSGQPYTPYEDVSITLIPTSYVTNIHPVTFKTNYIPVSFSTNKELLYSDDINSVRMPFSQQLSLRIDYTFQIFKKLDVSLYIDCWNVQWFWYKNTISYYYDLDLIETKEDIEKAKRPIKDLPIIPLIGIRIVF
ncbi:TonB-dependent receptor plug domain-containing protein [Spirochaetota bacterium]